MKSAKLIASENHRYKLRNPETGEWVDRYSVIAKAPLELQLFYGREEAHASIFYAYEVEHRDIIFEAIRALMRETNYAFEGENIVYEEEFTDGGWYPTGIRQSIKHLREL